MKEEIAKITDTMLGWEDHGILTCQLMVDYGVSAQGIGGYALDNPVKDDEGAFLGRGGTAYGTEFVARVMRACGVERWEDVRGRTILVLTNEESARVEGIAPLPTEPGTRFVFTDLIGYREGGS